MGTLANSKQVNRLEITEPAVYENFLVEGAGAGGNLVKITADHVTVPPAITCVFAGDCVVIVAGTRTASSAALAVICPHAVARGHCVTLAVGGADVGDGQRRRRGSEASFS